MRVLHAALLGVILLVGCGDRPVDDPRVRLRLQYEVGDTLEYEYTATGTVTRPDSGFAGKKSESYERRMRIDEVATEVTPRGNYRLAWTYHVPPDTLHMEARIPTQFTINVEITPRGRVIDVQNVETAKPFFGDLDFRTYLEQTQPVFPDRGLKVGDSWTQEVKVLSPEAEPVVTSSTYVLESLTRDEGVPLAVIAFDGDVYLPMTYELADSAEGLRSVEERIGIRGRMFFDHERGTVRRVESSAQAILTKTSFHLGRPDRRELEITQESTLRLVEPSAGPVTP